MAPRNSPPQKSSGFAEEPVGFEPAAAENLRATVEVGGGGRIVIPAAMREQMGIKEGSKLLLVLNGEELLMLTPEAGIRRAQRLFKQWDKGGGDIVEELLADRRREAAEEEKD